MLLLTFRIESWTSLTGSWRGTLALVRVVVLFESRFWKSRSEDQIFRMYLGSSDSGPLKLCCFDTRDVSNITHTHTTQAVCTFPSRAFLLFLRADAFKGLTFQCNTCFQKLSCLSKQSYKRDVLLFWRESRQRVTQSQQRTQTPLCCKSHGIN